MYSREIDGQVRSFGVTGKLWHGVLVMYDRETGSYWTQLDGRAIRGPEHGQRLDHVASVFTSWEKWVDAHPDTLVLEKTGAARDMTRSSYADYFSDPDGLFRPHLLEGLGEEIGAKEVVFGVRRGADALAVREAVLVERGVVNTTVGGEPLALLRNGRTGEVRAVVRRLAGRVLELVPIEGVAPTSRARDEGTGSVVSTDELPAARVDRAYWYAWKRTIPGTRVLAE